MSEKRVQKRVFKIIISILCLILTVSVAVVGLQSHNEKSTSYAPTVLIGNTQYVICGDEGEAEILKNCGLPAKLTADLVGKFESYLEYDGDGYHGIKQIAQ